MAFIPESQQKSFLDRHFLLPIFLLYVYGLLCITIVCVCMHSGAVVASLIIKGKCEPIISHHSVLVSCNLGRSV